MKLNKTAKIVALKNSIFLALALVAAMVAAPSANARTLIPTVGYSPSIQELDGRIPYSSSYTLAITAPAGITGSTTVRLNVAVNGLPPGANASTALSYVTLSSNSLTFTPASLTQNVTVTLTVPAGGTLTGNYSYEITTMQSDWPSYLLNTLLGILQVTDQGAFINATVSPATPDYPTVQILSPANQSDWTWVAGSTSMQIPYSFTASSVTGEPITSLTGSVNSAVIATTPAGLNVANTTATATGTFTVTSPGVYTVEADTTDAGGAASTNVQILVQAAPPTVTLNSPLPPNTNFTLNQGSTLSVPFSFTGFSNYGGITSLTATLDGVAVPVTAVGGLGQLTNQGTGTLSITTGGQHTLEVTATDNYGSASTNEILNVSVQSVNAPPTVTINSPIAPNLNFTMPATGALTVPFTFTGASTAGVITALTATVNNGATVNGLTFTNLNTLSANGAASLSIPAAGNYTLSVTATNATGTATSSEILIVAAAQTSKLSVAISKPTAGSTYTLTGSSVSVPYAFSATSTATSGVQALTATLNGQAVTFTPGNLNTGTASGSGNFTITTSGNETLVVTATDANGTATATTNFIVTGTAPCPKVTIGQISNGTTFTISGNNPLYIPVTFTGTTNKGFTVSALTASLNGSPISFTPAGLGTLTATGTASLKVTSAGTYIIVAQTVSGGVTATTSVNFTVSSSNNCNNGNNGGNYFGFGNNGYGNNGYGNYGYGDNGFDFGNLCYTFTNWNVTDPGPCVVNWQSCTPGSTQRGGSNCTIGFQIQYSPNNCWSNWNNYFNNCGTDYLGSDSAARNSWGLCSILDSLGNNSYSDRNCMNNNWNYSWNSGEVSCDTSVKVCVYEVYSNGSTSAATTYTCGSYYNSTRCTLNNSGQYQCNFTPGSGAHNYRADVYYYQGNSSTPTFLGCSTFSSH